MVPASYRVSPCLVDRDSLATQDATLSANSPPLPHHPTIGIPVTYEEVPRIPHETLRGYLLRVSLGTYLGITKYGIRRLEIACLRKRSRLDLPLVEKSIKVGAEARFPTLGVLPSPHS
ncbi:hypothetical protein HMPREF9134_00188 [Porphyromonas catoniae F0037]|uniref:Uncharacterized protein n=1 Tax=Porphyromonas catoniae F0037 TaxID=1127696 RepID=L1NIH6_9PORP|nr:hypothetical protein HMPREF9134_00188 [Porphyromonas catoniae F0037]